MSAPIRVVLAEHDAATRTGLRLALQRPGLRLVGEASDVDELLALAAALEVDVCLVAADLHGGGFKAVRTLTRVAPAVKAVVVSRSAGDAEFMEAITAGAVGYLGEQLHPDRLEAVIRAVAAGEAVVPRSFATALVDEFRGRRQLRAAIARHARAPLTERELEVLQLLGDDLSTAQLAHRLGISEVTVRRHASSGVAKLGARNRSEAIRLLRSGS